MGLLPENTHLGALSVLEILEYYDGPRLFSAESKSGRVYLVVWLGDEGTADQWLYVPISHGRLVSVRHGKVPLREAFARAEDGIVFRVSVDRGSAGATVEPVRCDQLADDDLPAPDVTLGIRDGASMPSREAFELALNPPHARPHEAPAGLVGAVLEAIQDVVDAIAQTFVPDLSDRAPIPRWLAQTTQLAVVGKFDSSFGVRLESASPLALFAEASYLSQALEQLTELIEAGGDRKQLRTKLSRLRYKTAVRYGNLLSHLTENGTDLVASWESPFKPGRARRTTLTVEGASRALQIIKEIEEAAPHEFRVIGILVAANLRTNTFEIDTEGTGERYRGKVLPEAQESVKNATLSERYSALLLEVTETNAAATRERVRYEMLSLRRLAPK